VCINMCIRHGIKYAHNQLLYSKVGALKDAVEQKDMVNSGAGGKKEKDRDLSDTQDRGGL
jgi:hypothetical protein